MRDVGPVEPERTSTRPTVMKERAVRSSVLIVYVLLVTACVIWPGGSGTPKTAVRGMVTAGPTCPVVTEPPDPACAERPVAGAVLVFMNGAGVEVARATSADDGTFSVQLAPGAYHLIAQPVDGLMGTPAPMDLQVEAGKPMTELQISYDTGIR